MRFHILTFILLVICHCCAAENFLQNGDFELGLDKWRIWGGHPDTAEVIDDSTAASGKKALQFTGSAEAKMTGVEQKHLSLSPGKTYSISFYLKTEKTLTATTRLLVGLLERGKRGKVQSQHYTPIRHPSPGKWVRFTVDITLNGASCEYYQFVFRIDRLGSGETILLDAVEVAEQNPDRLLDRSSEQAEASDLLKEWQQQSAKYRRRSGRTAIFSRAQLKYGLQRNDYLHKWIDRPLLVNPGLPQDGNFINSAAFAVMRDIVRKYRLDGFAFFPETSGREELYRHVTTPGGEMKILTELIYDGSRDFEKKLKVAEKALANPHSMRLDGKVVFTSYPASDDLDYWCELKKAMVERFGDRFLLMPYYQFFPAKFRKTGSNDTFSSADLQLLRNRICEWLRITDGYYHNTPSLKDRRYYAPLDREVILPIIHSVLLEPEFKNKYLAWGVKVGHENYELIGYSMDHAGTGMLRGTMETACLAQPDIINCVEWDEQNENTGFRPTLYNSWSTMRIMRYFSAVLNGNPEDLPGDTLRIPNLILSYRKILAAGQILELELLNVPDTEPEKEAVRVQLILRNADGREVYRFPWQSLSPDKLEAVTLELPVEDIVNHQTLVPELIVHSQSGEQIFSDGFQPIELRATWNWDYKWVKQPLRDLMSPLRAELRIIGKTPDGRLKMKAGIEAPEPLNSIEVMDCGDVAYSHRHSPAFRETDENYVICLNLQAKRPMGNDPPSILKGNITFQNVTPTRHLEIPANVPYRDGCWIFNNQEIDHRILQLFAELPRKNAQDAMILIDLPGYCQEKISVAEILSKEGIGFPGPAGFNLVAKRFNTEITLPPPWSEKAADFEFLLTPSGKNSVLHLQAVGQSGTLYRGKPLTLYRPSGKKKLLTVYSLKRKRPVTFSIDKALITEFNYLFSPEHGSILATDGPFSTWGIGGGYVPRISGRGSGESLYGNAGHAAPGRRNCFPQYRKEVDGTWCLDFNQSYVSLPQALVPPFGSWEITMDVQPRTLSGTQTLLGCDFTGFMLLLKNGIPTVSIYQNNNYETGLPALAAASGPPLRPDVWNKIRIRFDQYELTVETNGKSGTVVRASGYQRYPRIFGLGIDQRRGNYFEGKIRSLQIRHQTDTKNAEQEKQK